MTDIPIVEEPGALRRYARMLWADKFALAAALCLAAVLSLCALAACGQGGIPPSQHEAREAAQPQALPRRAGPVSVVVLARAVKDT